MKLPQPTPNAVPAFYVYVRSGEQKAFPVGPFSSKAAADEWVEPARAWAEECVDGMARFYEWGVAKLPRAPRPGPSNDAVQAFHDQLIGADQ